MTTSVGLGTQICTYIRMEKVCPMMTLLIEKILNIERNALRNNVKMFLVEASSSLHLDPS
jgi:hypothetical protein